MRVLIIAAAIAAAGPALADAEARRGADSIRITVRPCVNEKVLADIAAAGENPLDYRAARAEISGAPFAACWRPLHQRQEIHLRYDDGDQGLVPFSDLKPTRDT